MGTLLAQAADLGDGGLQRLFDALSQPATHCGSVGWHHPPNPFH